MSVAAIFRNLLIGVVLMLVVALFGCGERTEDQPAPEPPVVRKRVTMPKEELRKEVKPETEGPQATRPAEPRPEASVSQEEPEKRRVSKGLPGGMVKRPISEPPEVQPPQEKKGPSISETRPRVSGAQRGEKAREPQTSEGPPPKPAETKPSPKAEKPLLPPEERKAPGPLEAIGKKPAYSYDPKGKIDPFKPLFAIEAERMVAAKKQEERRVPLTPLQKLSLAQLKVVGVILLPGDNKALVEDPAGKSYIVREGTYVGQNYGRVKEIQKDKVIVEEELEDFVTGKTRLQRTELELRKNAGEM
jgi:type IV pilus assembly protein PilP